MKTEKETNDSMDHPKQAAKVLNLIFFWVFTIAVIGLNAWFLISTQTQEEEIKHECEDFFDNLEN